MPYLFACLKVGIAASLVGAIVGELPTGAVAGLGRAAVVGQLLRPDRADLGGAVCGGDCGGGVGGDRSGVIERATLRRMGMAR